MALSDARRTHRGERRGEWDPAAFPENTTFSHARVSIVLAEESDALHPIFTCRTVGAPAGHLPASPAGPPAAREHSLCTHRLTTEADQRVMVWMSGNQAFCWV